MAKKTVNIGTSVNKGNGDPLRTAFGKINDNFDEIYGAIGSDGSIFNPLSVDSHLLPDGDNTRDLGSPDKRWRDIFVAPGSLYIGNLKLSNDNGTLLVQQVTDAGLVTETPVGEPGSVTTDRLVNGAYTVSLDANGNLTFPQGTLLGYSDPGGFIINGAVDKDIAIYTYNGADAHGWTFGTDGSLTLPAGGDILDSNGDSVLGGGAGGGLSITDFGLGFTDTLDAGKITTSKLYNENPNQGLNNQYTLEVTDGGVVVLPDGSIINGATLKTIAGNYAGITAGPNGADEDSWMWVDNDGATIATKYSTDNHTWTFNNTGDLTLPQGGDILNSSGQSVLGGNANTGNFTFSEDTITNDNGLILSTDRGTLAIGTNMEVPGVAGHFHIGFDGSNSNPPSSDLFLGDDYNYVKLPGSQIDPANQHGVEIGSNARDSGNSHVWRFETDGGLKFPDGTTQTTAYTGQGGGGGTTVSNVWVQTFETATPTTDVPQVTMSVEYDSDGNIIALFSHVNPVNDSTYYSVGKYTTTGTRIWTTRFADDFFTDGWGLAVDNAGGFVYIAGRISADGGQDNATLTKISGVTGLVEWSKKYDFGYNSSSAVVDVNAEGDPVMVGFAEGEVDRYVTTTKIDQTDGSIIWSRALDGQGDEQAFGMAVGPSSEVVAVGYMRQLGDSSDTDDNMVVVKYNSAGVIQWQRAILFDEGFDSTGSDADIDSEGNIYVCGQYETDIPGPVSQLMCIVKFDSMGVKQWSRRVVGNCGAFTSSIVVGDDDHLYLSASTFAGTENTVTDIHLVLAKYEFDGRVVWQRLLDYTPGYAFGAATFGSDAGGSNLAVTQDYVAVGLGFSGGDIFGPGDVNAAIAQIPASGNVFTVGNWDFKSANFSGVLDSTASDILVANADKTDYDNIANISTVTVTLEEDSSNFLIGTLVTAPGGGNELVNGVHVFALESDGTLTLDGDPFTGSGLTDDKEIKVTVGNTDYWAIVNRANNDDDGVESSAVAYDSQGNLVMLHITDVNGNELDPAPDKLIISKFSPTATLLWQKQIQEAADSSTAHDVVIDSDDNIIVIFNQDDAVDLGDYVNIIKFDSNGNEIWKKLYSSSILSTRTYDAFDLVDNTVDSGTFEGNAVQVISATNVPDQQTTTWTLEESSNEGATWTTTATIVGFEYDSGLDRYYYYVSAGAPAVTLSFETKDYRLTTQSVNTFMEAAGAVTNGTHIYVTGAWNVNSTTPDNETTFILKVSGTDGTVAWAESIRFEEGAPDEAYGMEIDTAGNLILVGVSRFPDENGPNAAYVSKYSGVDGSHIWSRVILNIDIEASYSGGDITVDSQNNIFVSINAIQVIASENVPAATIAYIVKLNSSGTIQWARRAGPGPCASVATGIDTDSLGNVYLSALTTSQKNPIRDETEFDNTARDVLAIAKYSTSGAVLWQRYIEADGYRFVQSTDQGTDGDVGDFDHDRNHGRYLSLSNDGKIAVQVTVRKRDLDNDVIDSDYWESITFQIDQDGREMTIGSGDEKFSVKASRIPGKFVTLPEVLAGQPYSPTITNLVPVLDVTTPTITYAEAELAQYIIKSAPYEYVFGNNGTLTIPNDGDIKLTQTQIGWFSIFGPANNSNDDVWIRASCVDPDTGDVYVVGQEDYDARGFVARYNSQGEILWSIRLNDNDDGNDTRCNAVKIHPVTGNLVVLVEYYGNNDAALLLQIDPDTAQVVNELGFQDLGLDAGVTAYDFDFLDTGDSTETVVVVGRKYDERKTYSVTPQTGSTTDVLIINRSDLGSDEYTSEWRLAGTGITGFSTIDFNYYSGLTGTVRQGSGANFNIVIDGAGAIDNSSAVNAGGSNYRVGHKILIPYTAVNGSNNNADIIVTVTSIDNVSTGAITGTAMGYYGGGDTGSSGTYNAVSGANWQTGSGFEFDFTGPEQGTDYANWDNHTVTAGGTNYVEGDVVTIPGTQLGGTSPANDLTAIVDALSGSVTGFQEINGTSQNTTYRIYVTESTVDFGGVGSWNLSYNLGGEAFVWTPSWNKVVGSLNPGEYTSERYFSVAVGSDNSVYAVGEIYTDDSTSNYNAVVSKFNNLGVHQWSRALNAYTFGSSAKCVAVRGTTVAVSSYDSNNNETVITKLDTSGNIKWQRSTDSGDDSSVAIDTNGDIYAVAEGYFENKYENIIKVIRFASNGEPIWRKFFGTLTGENNGTNEYFKNGRNITLDAEHFYVSGYTTAFDDDAESGFLVKLPKSGDCDGYYGGWTVQSDAYDVDKVIGSQANTFTPNIGTGNFESWEPEFSTDWWDPSDDDYYQTLQPVVDRDGGAIEFADGTRQTTSAQQIPQIPITNGADHRLCLDDMGKHIYITNSDTRISVPYHYDNPLPIGFTVVIINNSVSGNVSIDADGNNLDIIVPGAATSQYWDLASPGMATLIKVTESLWFMTGNVSDDS